MGLLETVEVNLISAAVKIGVLAFTFFNTLHLFSGNYPKESIVKDGQCFDVIIVGAGSAGCVIANRLTEVNNITVLLIEAGDDPGVDVLIPGLFPFLAYSKQEWKWFSKVDNYTAQLHKERCQHYAIGKQLGGSSGTNYMFYVRGHRLDYQRWVASGATGWDWDNVLYYFKKSERLTSKAILNSPSGNLHCDKGLLGVSRPDWGNRSEKYLKAFRENGHRILIDNNDINPLGHSQASFTIDPPYRQSTAFAFLKPIKDRKNLFVLKNSFVRKVLFDNNKRAIGVEVKLHGGKIIKLCANKEVILSAGALNSPRILMSSGVGPKEHLKEHGIKVIKDSKNVGKNLQDHPTVIVSLTGEKNIASAVNNFQVLTNLDKFPEPSILGFASLNKCDPNAYPDYEIIGFGFPAGTLSATLICTHVFNYEDHICEAIAKSGQTRETFFALLSLLHPKSRGSVKLRSPDPEDMPIIDSGFYKLDEDLDKHASCMEDYVSVINTTYFKKAKSTVVNYGIKQCKHLTFLSHEYWKCHVRHIVQTEWHLTGTTAMGPEGVGVTDERLRVRGVSGLRVADGGSIPLVTSGNTNAPIIMLAEKASDLIKEDNGWPVEKFRC